MAVIICISLISCLNPQGWILADRIGSTGNNIIKVQRETLEMFPSIIEALHLADTGLGVYPSRQVKCSHGEGVKIVKYFGLKYFTGGNTYNLHLEVDGELYQLSIIFVHEPPAIA
jgi:hypothetical protein